MSDRGSATGHWTSAGHPLWTALLWTCATANAAVLLSGRYLPFSDLPEHAAAIATLRHYFDPSWRLQETFTLALGQTQYLLYYAVGALLSIPLGSAEHANLALLMATGFAWPFALRSLLRALGQDERVALMSGALFFNQSLLIGLFNYLAALPVLLWSLALAVHHARSPTARSALLLSAASVALFYLHLSALAFFVPAAALASWLWPAPQGSGGRAMAAALVQRLPRLGMRLVWMVPVAALCVHWLATSSVAQPQSVGWNAPLEVEFRTFRVNLKQLPEALIDVWYGGLDGACLNGLAVLAVWMLLFFRRGSGSGWAALLSGAWAALALVLYFGLPYSVGWLSVLNERYAIIAGLLLLPVLRPGPGWRGAVPLLLAGVLSLACAGYAAQRIHAFQREVGDFDQVLSHAQPGRRVLALIYEPQSSSAKFLPFHHFGAYYRARFGGVAEHSFVVLPQSPVRYRPEAAPPPKPFGWEWDPSTFRNEVDGVYFDYVLTRGAGEPFKGDPPGPQWKAVARSRSWTLYAKSGDPGR